MTHEELRERLLDLAYGELAPRDARAVEEHAATCEACGAELARIRGTRRMMSALPQEAAPEGGERILLAAAREAVRGKERRRVPRWLWATPVVAASLAAVVAVSLRLGAVAPPRREDPNALVGPSPYAQAPAAPAPAAEPPAAPPQSGAIAAAPDQAAPAERAAPPPAAGKKRADAPHRRDQEEESRWATAPPPGPAEERAAPAAPAAPPPAAPRAAPPPAAAGGAPGQAAPSADAGAVAALRAAPESKAEAPAPAPAPNRSAKALSAPRAAPGASGADAAEAGSLEERAASAVARYEELRRSGRLRAEVRAFPACAREPWRRVERDPDGRIVSYAWESVSDGRRLRLEAIYGPDGSLALKRAVDAQTGAPEALVKFRVPRVSEIDLDAPTLCDR
jgi:hypothetical protein